MPRLSKILKTLVKFSLKRIKLLVRKLLLSMKLSPILLKNQKLLEFSKQLHQKRKRSWINKLSLSPERMQLPPKHWRKQFLHFKRLKQLLQILVGLLLLRFKLYHSLQKSSKTFVPLPSSSIQMLVLIPHG